MKEIRSATSFPSGLCARAVARTKKGTTGRHVDEPGCDFVPFDGVLGYRS
jgi:hypothetical protein